MPFTAKSGKFNAKINTVEIGTGDKAIKIGGENVLPFYTFDDAIENAPKVGIEITDGGVAAEPECIQKCYEGCETVVDMAKKAASFEGVDFLSIRLEGADPNGLDKSTEELVQLVKDVAVLQINFSEFIDRPSLKSEFNIIGFGDFRRRGCRLLGCRLGIGF